MFTQITASAGAGKTYTLTQLFLNHLRAAEFVSPANGCALSGPVGKYNPEGESGLIGKYGLAEILAATFTNKAAAEMKDRVILALKEKALEAEVSKDLNHYERWLLAIFKQSSLLNIRTIDSLLFLLVRLSALELGLPPEITPSFNSEEYYTPLYDGFMTDIAAYNNGAAFSGDAEAPVYDIFSQALEDYYKALVMYANHDGFSLKNRLHDDIFRLVQRLLINAEVPFITSETLHTTINALHANLLASCDTMLDYIIKEELTVHKDLEKAITKAQASSAYDKLTNNKITQPGSREPAEIVTKKSLHSPSKDAQRAYEQLCLDYELFTSKIPVLLGALPLVPLIPLANELYKRILQTTLQTTLLPAELIPGFATHILTGEYGVSDTLCRMGNRLHHILLDEFQDTSVEQWRAIEPLVIECLSKGGSFTYVGDVKQAIYSWRKGEIRLFDGILETARELHRTPKLESLDKNWRSSPAIIQFNNAFFSLLNKPAVAQRALEAMLPPQTPEHVLFETRQRLCTIYANVEQNLPPENMRPFYVSQGSVHLYEIKARNAALLSDHIQARLLRLVPELLKSWKYEDITILTRSGEESANVAAWLTNANIPVITENSFMLADNPLVSRLVSLLAFVDYPYDDLALWEFLTGEECFGKVSGLSRQTLDMWLAAKREDATMTHAPVFQLFQKDFTHLWEKWLAPFHNRAGLMTAYDMLHEAMRIFRLFEERPTDAPFLTRLLELAHYAETQGVSSLAGFLQFWEKARQSEKLPSPAHMPAITIMTMHKAKGLEFPVVILPFQHGGRGLDDSLVVDNTLGFPFLTKISKFTSEPYFHKEAINAIECLNLLYVAWTRPKYELHSFITGHGRTAMLGKGLEVLLEEFMELSFDGYTYEECGFPEAGDEGEITKQGFEVQITADQITPAQTAPKHGDALSHLLQTSPEVLSTKTTASQQNFAISQANSLQHTPSNEYLMDWLPELKIYRTNLDNLTFTPTQRGDLFHLCLEHLRIISDEPASNASARDSAIANAVALGLQKFPFALPNKEALTAEITTALQWFSSLPQAGDWLEKGLREQSLLGADNQIYRVDLLVPEGNSFRAIDYKTGSMVGHNVNIQQVQAYMELLAQITRKEVRGTLVYLDLQKLVEVLP